MSECGHYKCHCLSNLEAEVAGQKIARQALQSENAALKAEVKKLQDYLQMDANKLAADRNRWKALAAQMKDALKNQMFYHEKRQSAHAQRCYSDCEEALALFDAEREK